eukprot:17533-Amorphochlora_amoeboformis.AAC.1
MALNGVDSKNISDVVIEGITRLLQGRVMCMVFGVRLVHDVRNGEDLHVVFVCMNRESCMDDGWNTMDVVYVAFAPLGRLVHYFRSLNVVEFRVKYRQQLHISRNRSPPGSRLRR